MVNDLLRVVILYEIHGDVLPVKTAERFFGASVLDEFTRKFPSIPVDGGYIGAGSREKASEKRRIARAKVSLCRRYLRRIAWVPWIRFASITGSISFGNTSEGDDIDVFLVVDENRLWLTRLLEQVVLRLGRVRRTYGSRDIKDRICINYYLSRERLALRPSGPERFMTALELVSMIPVLEEDFYTKLLNENAWVSEYFPVFYKRADEGGGRAYPAEQSLLHPLLDGLDFVAMHLSILYMRLLRHPVDKAVVQRNSIQFYDMDGWKDRIAEFESRLEGYDM